MPSATGASDPHLERPGDRWRMPGLVLLGVWAGLLVVAVALWVRVAVFPGQDADSRGLVTLVGVPFVLVALGLLWWAWRSAHGLRDGRRDGWTLLLVLGGVSAVQSVLTARAVLASSGPPREVLGGLLVAIGLGSVTFVVALLGRRSWAADDRAAEDRAAEDKAADDRAAPESLNDPS